MTQVHRTVLPLRADTSQQRPLEPGASLQVAVHIYAEVMAPERAQHIANVWLAMNAGHLLLAENPELLLNEPLQRRFDVFLTTPDRTNPGSVTRALLGRMFVNAMNGAVIEPDALIEELTAHAAARSIRSA